MGYKSYAQQKAVHAHKADGGKGHPDKKKGSPAKMENDSIAAANAWKKFKKEYMDRTHKMKGTKYEKPLSAEDNLNEYNKEKNEFYYDTKSGKIKLIPTNDSEEQDRSGIEKWQLAPSMKSKKIIGQDTGKVQTDKKGEYVMHGTDTIRPADNKKFRPFVNGKQSGKMPSGYLSDDDYTVKNGRLSPSMKKSPLNLLGIGRGRKIAKDIMENSPLKKISGPCKAAAKKKFKVWPSAYASGWGVRCTKAGGPSNYGGGKKK